MPSTLPRSSRTPPLRSHPIVPASTNISDTTDFGHAIAANLRIVGTIGAALDGSDKPFVVTSAILLVAISAALSGSTPGRLATEEDPVLAGVPRVASWRGDRAGRARGASPTSSARTRALLGWRPEHPALIADIEAGNYFNI